MATRIILGQVDDITGQPGATTVRFGLDGARYEIDLADAGAGLRRVLAPWISAARPAGGRARRTDLHLIRRWARQNGHRVPARGPLPAATMNAYDDHHRIGLPHGTQGRLDPAGSR